LTTETRYFLEKARKLLLEADFMLRAEHYDAAGRAAYLAGLHAAQALIFERNGRSVKTHRGVQIELNKLLRDTPHIDSELREFLSFTYDLKSIADYEVGPGSEVTQAMAKSAVGTAEQFVATAWRVKISQMPSRIAVGYDGVVSTAGLPAGYGAGWEGSGADRRLG